MRTHMYYSVIISCNLFVFIKVMCGKNDFYILYRNMLILNNVYV